MNNIQAEVTFELKRLHLSCSFEPYDISRRIFLGSNIDYLKNHDLFIDNLLFPCKADIYGLSALSIPSIERLLTSIKLVLHNLYTSYNILHLHITPSINDSS